MTVEFVLLGPLLVALMLFLYLAGRVVEAHDQVDGAARDAARAASLARTAAGAQAAADQAVSADVNGWCAPPSVLGFVPGSPAVTVSLRCDLNLGITGLRGVPVTGYAVAPLDQFVARSY
jgi:Flp pilus assembly protein TadG